MWSFVRAVKDMCVCPFSEQTGDTYPMKMRRGRDPVSAYWHRGPAQTILSETFTLEPHLCCRLYIRINGCRSSSSTHVKALLYPSVCPDQMDTSALLLVLADPGWGLLPVWFQTGITDLSIVLTCGSSLLFIQSLVIHLLSAGFWPKSAMRTYRPGFSFPGWQGKVRVIARNLLFIEMSCSQVYGWIHVPPVSHPSPALCFSPQFS